MTETAETLSNETNYQRYIADTSKDISATIKQFGCQPILFIGSGLSRRYFGAPSWDELLRHLAKNCSLIDKGLGFYKQSLGSNLKIGEEFAKKYQEWAWSAGKNEFPETLFHESVNYRDYIKYKIATYLEEITPDLKSLVNSSFKSEIESLLRIKPHAIITTNYDKMTDILFDELTPVIGQKILKGQNVSIGEIFKIHGCISEFQNIIFTDSDYDEYVKKKKFLHAKLLTFFNEHPLIFIGYSATDPNIISILSDIDQALPEKNGLVPNVYILEWNKSLNAHSSPAREKMIPTEEGRSVRVKLIEAADFSWVFDAFSSNPVLNNVSPRVLRALLARSYDLVRHDIPKMKIEANFRMLNESVETSDKFASLFGIAKISDYSFASTHYKYTATRIGKLLGKQSWHITNALIQEIYRETGKNIKSFDNIYHRTEKLNTSVVHKYSEDALILFRKVKSGEPYELVL